MFADESDTLCCSIRETVQGGERAAVDADAMRGGTTGEGVGDRYLAAPVRVHEVIGGEG